MGLDICSCDVCGEERITSDSITSSCRKCGESICDYCLEKLYPSEYRCGECMDQNGEVIENFCPMCQGNVITKDMVLKYLLQKIGMTMEEAMKEVRDSIVKLKEEES